MENFDLSTVEKYLLNFCNECPNYQYVGIQRTSMNVLASYKLVTNIGNLKYEITEKGRKILHELSIQPRENSEEIPPELVGKLGEAATSA